MSFTSPSGIRICVFQKSKNEICFPLAPSSELAGLGIRRPEDILPEGRVETSAFQDLGSPHGIEFVERAGTGASWGALAQPDSEGSSLGLHRVALGR